MKILVIGSCRNNDFESKNEAHQELARRIGIELAQRGHHIMTGAAGGLQGILAHAYKDNSGTDWIAYYAKDEEKDPHALSETSPDKIIMTRLEYPRRNAFYTGICDSVVALSGKIATLGEIISAVKGYDKRVFQLDIGENVHIIPKLSELEGKVLISSNIKRGLDFLEGKQD